MLAGTLALRTIKSPRFDVTSSAFNTLQLQRGGASSGRSTGAGGGALGKKTPASSRSSDFDAAPREATLTLEKTQHLAIAMNGE